MDFDGWLAAMKAELRIVAPSFDSSWVDLEGAKKAYKDGLSPEQFVDRLDLHGYGGNAAPFFEGPTKADQFVGTLGSGLCLAAAVAVAYLLLTTRKEGDLVVAPGHLVALFGPQDTPNLTALTIALLLQLVGVVGCYLMANGDRRGSQLVVVYALIGIAIQLLVTNSLLASYMAATLVLEALLGVYGFFRLIGVLPGRPVNS